MTGSNGKIIALGVFAIPLLALGIWIWNATPEREDMTGPASSGGAGIDEPGALAVSAALDGPRRLRVTFSNASKGKIAIVVPGDPAGVLRIVEPGAEAGPPRALAFHPNTDARVELLPGAGYNHVYRVKAAREVEVIYDSRGSGLPEGTWCGLARSGPAREAAEEDRAGETQD